MDKDIKLLNGINSPEDLKKLSEEDLPLLADEIRQVLIDTVSHTGGHLASNLGAVELTLAIHRVFDSPKDRIVWDVGHQAYTHKLITGRYGAVVILGEHRQQQRHTDIPQFAGRVGVCGIGHL